jgi:hypothetical protein
MRLNILGDFDWESRVDHVLNFLNDLDYRSFFQDKSYGDGLLGVSIVVVCQDSSLNLKQRIRFAKKEKKLYVDVLIDLLEMKTATPEGRVSIIAKSLVENIPKVIIKYNFDAFDSVQFIKDFEEKFSIF